MKHSLRTALTLASALQWAGHAAAEPRKSAVRPPIMVGDVSLNFLEHWAEHPKETLDNPHSRATRSSSRPVAFV
jgi:hypothetical protein